jgi:hypothetical protein
MTIFSKLTHNLNEKVLTSIFKSTFKNFLIGCSITTLLQIFGEIQKLFGMRKTKESFNLKKCATSALQTGCFLSSWTFLHQMLIRIFEKNLQRPKAISLIASGTISGAISMYFTQGLSWQTSLYFLYRSLFGVYRIKKNIFPSWTDIPDYLAYCIINFFLGIISQRFSEYVEPNYANFLSYCANLPVTNVDFFFQQKSELLPVCSPGYHKEESCLESAKYRIPGVFTNNLKVQLSFQILSYLLKGNLLNPKSFRSYLKLWQNLLKGTFKTTLFLSVQCAFCGQGGCILKSITPKKNLFLLGLIWFFSSFAILFESSSRRSELTVFTIWRVTTGFFNLLTDTKSKEKNSDEFNVLASTFLFGMASCFSVYCLYRDPSKLKSLDQGILSTLFPKNLLK